MRFGLKKAEIGGIVPIFKVTDFIEPVKYFSKLSDYGKKKNSMLFESRDIVPKYGEISLGTADPCLKVKGVEDKFEIRSLNKLGEDFIEYLDGDFDFADEVEYNKRTIRGILKPKRAYVSEKERLKLTNHADILRAVAFKFKPTKKPLIPYAGLFGAISYDFIDQFEDLPKNKKDVLKDPDYEMNFVDNLFLTDHKKNKTYFIANALLMDDDYEAVYDKCEKTILNFEDALKQSRPQKAETNIEKGTIETDTSQKEYEQIVRDVKEHIINGDVFQVVLARKIIADYNAEPLDIYAQLRDLNPSPYMFFLNNDDILLGASPEMAVRVWNNEVEMRPIAGTRARGLVNGKIDKELDSRYEVELKSNEKELAEHTMLVDLARNDIAKISKPGTRHVDEPFIVEKYSHVQHLVSNVRGVLKDDLDCLHAYTASMNMGTLTGAPKVMAMKLIREKEKSKRGFYGGSVGYITPSGDMDTCIAIRSIELKHGKAYIGVGAGIVYDSVPVAEFIETENKAKAMLLSLKNAGGIEYV